MRFLILTAAALAGLAACSPPVPDSGGGVGFGNYEEYQRAQQARDAELAGNALPGAGAISGETPEGQVVADADGSDLAAETQAALGGEGEAPAAVTDATGISRENDFEAVGEQRSIESDAARIAQNRQQYKVIEAEALPARPGSSGPNIVDYALATRHPPGTQVYRRIGVGLENKATRACGRYTSPDKAQSAFLDRGGPQRDQLGLDPDGDGYACGWDPRPFRKAVGG